MKWLITIWICLISALGFSQVYHETKQGNVRILSSDSTTVLVEFDASEFEDVSEEYQSMAGLRGKRCLKYSWKIVEEGRINHKGLFVVKTQDDDIYAVWYYEDTEDGRGRLSALLRKTFDY